MNNTLIVGRLVDDPKTETIENGSKVLNMTIAVSRTFKNADGEYETDFVDCVAWNAIADSTAEYCRKGDIIGVKGRLQTDLYEKDGQTHKSTKLIADRISFLSSNKEASREEEKNTKDKSKNSKSKSKEK